MEPELWAVFDPDGKLILGSLRHKEHSSIRSCFDGLGAKWAYHKSMGYTCRRVRVVPVEESDGS